MYEKKHNRLPINPTPRPAPTCPADPDFVHLNNDMRDSMAASQDVPGSRTAVVLNRFGVRSETSGELRFRCHAVTCSPSSALLPDPAKSVGTKTRSVDEILKSFTSTAGSATMRGTFTATMGSTRGTFTGPAGLSLGGGGLSNSASREGGVSLAGLAGNRVSREDSVALARRAEQLLAQVRDWGWG